MVLLMANEEVHKVFQVCYILREVAGVVMHVRVVVIVDHIWFLLH